VAGMGQTKNAYRILVGRTPGKLPVVRPKRTWEDNINKYLRKGSE
jgi:hypothetical protein